MAPYARRALSSAALVGTTAAGLLAATAIPASAATAATFHNLSAVKAIAALPAAAQLPAGVKAEGKVLRAKVTTVTPCGTASPKISFSGASGVSRLYAAAGSQTIWTVSAVVFATTPKATAAAKSFLVAEAKCPVKITDSGATLTHTVAAPDTAQAGLWKGFRGVVHLTDPSTSSNVRVWTTWFVRGNVLIEVDEVAPITKSTQAAQDAWRKAITNTFIANVDKAAL